MSDLRVQSQAEGERLEAVCDGIKAHLEGKKERLYEEIRSYPRPIPACDAQFNQLLDELARVVQALARLEQARGSNLGGRDGAARLEEFVRALDDRELRRIWASFAGEVARPEAQRGG